MDNTKARLPLVFKRLKTSVTGRSAESNKDEAYLNKTTEYKGGDDYDYSFKVVLIGDSGVGKSSLLSRFTSHGFKENYRPTIGAEFASKFFEFDAEVIKAQIWDTAGQDSYRVIANAYYQGAKGALIVYNVNKRSTFESVERWLRELRDYTDPIIVVMLVGNMIDGINLREVSSEEGKSIAERESLYFIETSALDSTNVSRAFFQVIARIYQKSVGKKWTISIEDRGRDIVARRNNDTTLHNLVQKDQIVQQSEIHSTNTTTCSTREIESLEKVKLIFQQFDANDDGALNRSELTTLIITVNPQEFTDEQIEGILEELFRLYSDFFHGEKVLTYMGLVRAYDDRVGDMDLDRDFNAISTLPEISLPSCSLRADRRVIDDHFPEEEPGLNLPEDGELLPFQTKSEDEISVQKVNPNDQSAELSSRNFSVKETSAFENPNDLSTLEICEKCSPSDDTISEISDLINYNDQNGLENRGTSSAVHGNDGVGLSTTFKMEQIKGELKHSFLNTIRLTNSKTNLRPAEDIAYYMYWEHITWTEDSPMASQACLHQPTSCHFCKIFQLGEVDSNGNSYWESMKAVSKKVQWFQVERIEKRKNANISYASLDRQVKELERKEVEMKQLDKIVKKHEKHSHITSKTKSLVISRRKLSSSTVNEVSDLENYNEQTLAIKGTSDVVYGFGVSDSGQIKMKDTKNKINYGHITYNIQGQIRKHGAHKKRSRKAQDRDSKVELPQLSRACNYKRAKEAFTWVTIGCLTLLFLLYRRRSVGALH